MRYTIKTKHPIQYGEKEFDYFYLNNITEREGFLDYRFYPKDMNFNIKSWKLYDTALEWLKKIERYEGYYTEYVIVEI